MPRGENSPLKNHDYAVEMGRKGAQKMKENMPKIKEERARRKQMREDLEYLLEKVMRGTYVDPGCTDTSVEKLAARHGKNITSQQAIMVSMIVKAANGDIEAAKFIRDTIGEKQADKVEASVSYEDYVKNHKVKF